MPDKSADDFMNDQLQALLASPVLARVAERHSEGSDAPVISEDLPREQDSEPNTDVQILREALRARLK